MNYKQINFVENNLPIKEKLYKYYLSPIFVLNEFKHGFFTKISSEIDISLLSKHINQNNEDCFLNQIHSNKVIYGSKTQESDIFRADGLVSDKKNQNLWIYTADCMPILFADKKKRSVAAIHCGRRGLEKKIIKNIIKIFYDKGSSNEDLIVSIGPSISRKYYSVDNQTLRNFYKQTFYKDSIFLLDKKKPSINFKKLVENKSNVSAFLDLKKYAHIQLLTENIPCSNIDISNLCTYESNHEFHSWRKSKTYSRQWNFISSS